MLITRLRSLLFRTAVVLGLLLGGQVLPAHTQTVASSAEALDEIRTLTVRADVQGAGSEDARLARLLEDVIRQDLRRANILRELGEPRPRDCCVLRLDVRLATGSGPFRFSAAYTVRLEMGLPEQVGRLQTWTVLWQGRMLGNIVEQSNLTETLRFTASELTGHFIDLFRERFPIR